MSALITRGEYLDDLADVLETCQNAKSFIPIVSAGRVSAMRCSTVTTVDADISVEDFVLGSEALGLTFALHQLPDGIYLVSSCNHGQMPDGWASHGLALAEAFRAAARTVEIAEYLRDRGDAVIGRACTKEVRHVA